MEFIVTNESKSDMPMVSVIFMCWNIGSYVIDAIKSVLASNYPNLEIICLEDASDDGVSRELLVDYFNKNNIGKLILNEFNLGMSKNLNKGLALATGKYLTWLGDDLIFPEKIWDDVEEFETLSDDYVVVHSICQYVESGGNTRLAVFAPSFSTPKKIKDDRTLNELIMNESGAAVPTVTFRTKILKEIGGWDESLLYEDKPMWFRLTALGYKFRFRPVVTTLYRIHPKQLSNEIRPTALHYQMKLLLPYKEMPEARFHLKRLMGMALGHYDFKLCIATYREVFGLTTWNFLKFNLIHIALYSITKLWILVRQRIRQVK